MPYIDIISSDDYASIWYQTNAPNSNVGGFDPNKPTVVLLHPQWLDSTWLHPQMDDTRLASGFNIIAFDTRSTGKSLARPTSKYDLWITTADLAYCFQHLRLSPAHIFACDLNTYVALRFAILFPELCLSLTLCNMPAQSEVPKLLETMGELVHLWSFAEDLESFEYSCKELLDLYVGSDASIDLQDELVSYWEVHYPPFRRSFVITNVNLYLNRTRLTAKEMASVTCPVVIIQAERCQTHPMNLAEQVAAALVNVPGGANIFSVRCTQGYLALLSASIVNQVLYKFISRLPPARSDPVFDGPGIAERMKAALAKLATLHGDSSIAERDPLSPLSFSCASAEVVERQTQAYELYRKGERTAYSPLAADGRPLRKFSERKDHWLDGDADGFSYSTGKIFDKKKKKSKPERQLLREERIAQFVLQPQEPMSEEAQQVSRLRRATINPSIVDKQLIKGTMVKVASSTVNNVATLPRILR